MTITKKPKFVIPKKQGEWPDLLHKMRQERLALQKQVDELEANEKAFKEHIILTIPKSNVAGVMGQQYKIQVLSKEVPQVKDWTSFYAYVKKTSGFDLLNKALNKAAVQERWDAGKQVPGVEVFDAVTVSLTKI